MNKKIIFTLTALCATIALSQTIQTPFDMAMVLEKSLASGVGIMMIDTDKPYMQNYGTLPLPVPNDTGFSQDFLNGLVPVEEFGIATYPLSLRVDDITGKTIFYNANNEFFWEIAPTGTYDADWIVLLRGVNPTPDSDDFAAQQMNALLRPSHVAARWVFVAPGNEENYRNAQRSLFSVQQAAKKQELKTVMRQSSSANSTGLIITDFTLATNVFYFTARWDDLTSFLYPKMGVLFTTNLIVSDWMVIKDVDIHNYFDSVSFKVPTTYLPAEPVSSLFTHEINCLPTTNIIYSPLSPSVTYTNTSCLCVSSSKTSAGYFSLMISEEENAKWIPLWWKILYGLSPYDSWEDNIDFNFDGSVNRENYEQGTSPIAPPNGNGVTGATIQYYYDDDDRLTASFVGADGDAAVTHITPAGNPNVQQERTAQ